MLDVFKITLYSVQAVAVVVAAYTYNNYKHTAQKYFFVFIAYSFINDFGFYVYRLITGERFYAHYNICVLLSGLFYLFWFHNILKANKSVLFSSILFTAVFVYSLIFGDFFGKLNELPFLTCIILILLYVIQYFVELLNRNEVVNYLEMQEFWTCVGVLVFHLGYLPFILLSDFVTNISGKVAFLTVLNILMYGCFIKGFLCTKKK